MTQPPDFFATPAGGQPPAPNPYAAPAPGQAAAPPPAYGATPGYGAAPGYPSAPPPPPPAYGAPPGYGTPQGGHPLFAQPYGQQYGQPAYGMPAWSAPRYASWGARVGASLIDGLIMLGIFIAVAIVGAVLASADPTLGGLVMMLGYLAGMGFYVWQLIVQGRTGQTIGKKQVGIRLVRARDGQVVGGGMSVVRYLAHNLEFGIGYLWPLWDQKHQTFADKICETVVIQA